MYICCCVNNLNRKFLNLPPLEQFMKMPPKKENSNNNQCRNGDMSSTFGNEHTAIITVSSTSNNNNTNNNNNCNENSNNYNNSNNSNNNHHSNATVITSLVTRSTTAALNVCSSSNNNTAINANNNSNNNNSNNHNNNSNSNYNNNNQNNNSATTMTMTDNGSTNQLMYVNDIAAEQRTIAYQANAKLCRLVRKCPWMYDRNHHNYAKKHILDKSWTKIAKECNDSVVSCKERWRNIRAAFARSINIYKTHSGPNRVKPYYLHKELTFLVKPMMEGRDRRDEFEEDSRLDIEASGGGDIDGGGGTEEEDDDDEELEQDDDDQEDQDEPDEMKSFEAFKPAITIHTDEYPLKNNIRMVQDKIYHNNSNGNHNNYECNSLYDQHNEFPSTSDAEAEFNFSNDNGRHIDRQLRSSNNFKRPMYLATDLQCDAKRTRLMSSNLAIQEADVCFLEAVLPDMALMNTRQKIIFKRKLYQTLEEVLENSTNFPCYQQSSQKDTQSYSHMNNSKCNNSPTSTGNSNISSNNNTNSNLNNNNNNNNSNSNVGMPTATPITTATTLGTGNQVRQTILTVNSSMARTLINSIAQLSEAELQKVSGFLQTHLRNHNMTGRLTNGSQLAPSSAAAHLMHSTPKITITKVTCPPPSALRNLNANSTNNNNCSQTQTIATPSLVQLSTPTVSTTALATQTIVHSTGMINSNVHSTTAVTASAAAAAAATAAATVPFSINTRFQMASNTPPVIHTASNTINNINNTSNSIQNGSAAWSQLLPITIKDEVEDVDID